MTTLDSTVVGVPAGRTDAHLALAVTEMLARRAQALSSSVIEVVTRALTQQTVGDTCVSTEAPVAALGGLVSRLDGIADAEAARRDVEATPFVSAGNYFFTQRHFLDELSVAANVRRLASVTDDLSPLLPQGRLESLLYPDPTSDHTTPLEIGRSAMSQCFNLMVGGPGTGKTHNLTRFLALYTEALLARNGVARIAVCAPTGKAATRAKEMLDSFCKDEQSLTPAVRNALNGMTPTTIHRLLGSRPGAPGRFRHEESNPLMLDVLIVDEMSMVALPLMARLLEAVPTGCRVLLVGDEAQLESIEVGAVLAQLNASAGLAALGRIGTLKKVFRQGDASAINPAAYAIREGEVDALVEILRGHHDDLAWVTPSVARPDTSVVAEVADLLRPAVVAARTNDAAQHAEALHLMAGVKVLCGPRHGVAGVYAWNAAITSALGLPTGATLAAGTPVLVTANAPSLHLVNGSIGVVVATDAGPRVAFPPVASAHVNDEHHAATSPVRYLSLTELPPFEVCFAMTVHKSQGSEYDRLVVAVLPNEQSPLLSRQLLYTALTRAKRRAIVIGREEAIRAAVARTATRTSGIAWMVDQLLAT